MVHACGFGQRQHEIKAIVAGQLNAATIAIFFIQRDGVKGVLRVATLWQNAARF